MPHTATNDIGRVANEVDPLVIVEVEAPESYSPNEIAKILSDILGKSVPATVMSEDDVQAFCIKCEWPKVTADNWIEMFKGFNDATIC
ncbi:unnamed protein product [Adineta ricciae]|uniref:Uncharacterized protein n=1 Tax=Adineta ricciae TaxID=249248 RepID=A0A815DBZ8_ADIRI|nr:unnamed protein product [Adineta ricciae]CAF1297672.1 unnamed protein product [Adineta ricciae]